VEPGWLPLPLDHDLGANSIESMECIRIEIEVHSTRVLLTKARQALGMEMHDVLLAALGCALGEWTAAPAVGVLVEGHGREAIADAVNVSRTIGWFTSMYPIRLETPCRLDRREYLLRTRELLDAVPDGGLGYGLLRYMLQRPELAGRPHPDVNFNYQGQFVTSPSESRFSMAREAAGPLIGAHNRRWACLNVECVVVAGRLVGVFAYSRHKHRAETIDALAQRFAQELREIATLCADSPLGGGTPHEHASPREQAAAGV
jgi:non-ribosomal peptide synthase protein (TIGR01720 family)